MKRANNKKPPRNLRDGFLSSIVLDTTQKADYAVPMIFLT